MTAKEFMDAHQPEMTWFGDLHWPYAECADGATYSISVLSSPFKPTYAVACLPEYFPTAEIKGFSMGRLWESYPHYSYDRVPLGLLEEAIEDHGGIVGTISGKQFWIKKAAER